jgi:hypothetical protein
MFHLEYIVKIVSITRSLNLSKEKQELTKPGLFIYEIYSKAGISTLNAESVSRHIEAASEILSQSIILV